MSRLKFEIPSDSALVMSCWVAAALVLIHGIFAIPSLWSSEQKLLSTAFENEKVYVENFIRENPATPLQNIPLPLQLKGLVLYKDTAQGGAAAGKQTITRFASIGDVPKVEWVDVQQSESMKRDGKHLIGAWTIDYHGRSIKAKAKINIEDSLDINTSLAIKQLFVGLASGLAGGIVALLLVIRYFVNPTESILVAIRKSRSHTLEDMPTKIDVTAAGNLSDIAGEFNGLIEEQKKAARQVQVKQQYLEYAAHHDPLTHLANRLMFDDKLRKTVSSAVNENEQFAIFLIDLDNFKFFNDQYGHLIGDKMVVEVGSRLTTVMRDIDLVARLDGDEFVVIQKDIVDKAAAEEIAKRLMALVTAPFEYRGFTLKASVSVGISHFPGDVNEGHDEEMLVEEIANNAAVALQEAKTNGKNQYQLFNESMRSRLTARIRLEQDLKEALMDEQFEVYYQPKININTRQVTGAEALVRWNHPKDGRISPEVFVPVAEESGMIIEIGEWILRTACRQTDMLQQIGFKGLNVAVNISAVQFTDGNLLPMVSKALKDSNLKPELLELEITESAVMHDPEEVIHSLHELSRFGMKLAIDDFGTGYSSLAYLKRFPVDTLKIDRAFITDISSDNDDVAIVEAVLGLGSHFNMKVVAEGVEDEDQLVFLREQGCDLAQGYFISQPMDLRAYIAWLEQWPFGIQGRDPVISSTNITSAKLKKAS